MSKLKEKYHPEFIELAKSLGLIQSGRESTVVVVSDQCDLAWQAWCAGRDSQTRNSLTSSPALTLLASRKLEGLLAEGYLVNGVAIFNPGTGRRGLVDYLGYVAWHGPQT